ncbi:SufE family protein [Chitiniphilus purpureus]|uniref:SufE family protein n=1 Tax=Chitiniphilus purpureus TaxID=2981137 RepID=A0ABY6DI82_9NEIS|nr:SufE family protein [Chitiniphilus sp. CD1]UXY14059.1 SufE family protein [Chitiniphilus sp. CD1]
MIPDRPTLSAALRTASSWEAKNRLLVQLAREAPSLPEALRDERHRVPGCESRVWLVADWQQDRLVLQLDSDSKVVKGLLVLLLAAYGGQTRDAVLALDFNAWLGELGLARFLTSSRANGIAAIVDTIRRLAGGQR